MHVCARVAPSRKRAAMFIGNTVDKPKPGLIASKHLTVASTTSSVLKLLRFVTFSSMSLKRNLLVIIKELRNTRIKRFVFYHYVRIFLLAFAKYISISLQIKKCILVQL